jgi:hypothetical protein
MKERERERERERESKTQNLCAPTHNKNNKKY